MSEHTNPGENDDSDRSSPEHADSDRSSTAHVDEARSSSVHVRWSDMDHGEMQRYFWRRIAPAAASDGIDVESTKPTHDWLAERDYRSFVAALRRHHDQSFGDFWTEHVAVDSIDGYDWATDDAATIDALEHFLDRRESRYNLAASSIDTLRYRLNAYLDAFETANDHAALLEPVARDADVPAYRAVDEVFAAFDHLNESSERAPNTIERIANVVDAFYGHLVSRRLAATNPASGLDAEFKWNNGSSGVTPALDTAHVQALVDAADTAREHLLVVALAAWGLRANEVASLHHSQIVRDAPDVPRLEFESRKNGPGSVSLLYGMDALDDRLAELADHTTWNGYLFPSERADSGHVSRQTIWRHFRDLADRASLPDEIDGERPSPQLCRRFWYDRYSETLEDVVAGLEDVAAEQGSSDPSVVLQNYLSEDRARQLRRDAMRDKLATAFAPIT